MLESIEIRLRTEISYYLTHQHGALGHLDRDHFRNDKLHARLSNRSKYLLGKRTKTGSYSQCTTLTSIVGSFLFGSL